MNSEIRFFSSLFGLPLVIGRNDAKQIVEALEQLWVAQTGLLPRTIDEDLDNLFYGLFDPRASGSRLRDKIGALPEAPRLRSRLVGDPLVIGAGVSLIVTPEGRAIYGLLQETLSESEDDPIGIDLGAALSVLDRVYEGYRRVGVRRLQDAVRLLDGEAEGLRLPSIGMVLLLLVNGSTSPDKAIRRPRDAKELSRLDASVATAVAAFADTISQRQRDSSHFSLYSGYAITEARRRLGNVLGTSPDEIYVEESHIEAVIDRLASELRRTRRSPETALVMDAFDNLVSAYRAERPTWASLGVAHETRAVTALLRMRLEHALGNS